MAFQVPESKRSIKQNQFEFTLPNGENYSIPKAKYLTVGQVELLANKGDKALSITDILELFGTEAEEAVRQLDTEQLQALLKAWQADSNITAGES